MDSNNEYTASFVQKAPIVVHPGFITERAARRWLKKMNEAWNDFTDKVRYLGGVPADSLTAERGYKKQCDGCVEDAGLTRLMIDQVQWDIFYS